MVDKTTYTTDYTTLYPFNDWFVENPFSSKTIIKNRRAGYRPLQSFNVVVKTKEELCPMTYQTSCDIILPKNLCYRKHREIITQPEGDDD